MLKSIKSLFVSVLTAVLFMFALNIQAAENPEQYMQGKATPEQLYQEGDRLYKAAGFGCDKSDAINYFKAAGEQGNLDAQVRLGDMYGFGAGVEPGYEMAAYWYIKAADQGSPKAQLYMGNLYASGLGVEQNKDKALKYMKLAAENKDSDSDTKALAQKRIKAITGQ